MSNLRLPNSYPVNNPQMPFNSANSYTVNQMQNQAKYYSIRNSNKFLGMNTSQYLHGSNNVVKNVFGTYQMPFTNLNSFQINSNLTRYNNIYGNYLSNGQSLPIVTNTCMTPSLPRVPTRIQDQRQIVAGLENNVWPHLNDVPLPPCPRVSQYHQNINYNVNNSNKQDQINYSEIKISNDCNSIERPSSSNVVVKEVPKYYKELNAIINIILLGCGTVICKSEDIHEIYYICDYPRIKGKIQGETHIKLNFADVKRAFTDISLLKIEYIDFKTGKTNNSKYEKITGDSLNLWVKTNSKGKNYIVRFIFMSSDQEDKFSIKIRLKTSKDFQRKSGKDKNKERKKGYYDTKNRIEIINELLVIEQKEDWKLFQYCPLNLSESNKEDRENLLKNLKENAITNINENEDMKKVITVILQNNIDDKNKNNLLILCFNIIYKSILDKNADKDITGYLYLKKFITKYNIGHNKDNDIVLFNSEDVEEDKKEDHEEVDEEDIFNKYINYPDEEDIEEKHIIGNTGKEDGKIQEEKELKSHDKQYNKRKCPEEEYSSEPCGKRTKIGLSDGDGSRQTDKNSEFEVLLVDHYAV